MKKNFFIILFLAGFFLQAQNMTLNLGLNHASQYRKVSDTKIDDSEFNLGYLAGVNFDFDLNKHWFLSPGLFFETKGVKSIVETSNPSQNSNNASFPLTYRLFYINIPVLIKKSFTINDNLETYFGAGPYVGFRIGGCVKTDSCGSYDSWFLDTLYKTMDFGIQAETGLVYKQKFIFNLSYEYGISNIGKDFNVTYLDPIYGSPQISKIKYHIKNRVLSLSLGYRFKL